MEVRGGAGRDDEDDDGRAVSGEVGGEVDDGGGAGVVAAGTCHVEREPLCGRLGWRWWWRSTWEADGALDVQQDSVSKKKNSQPPLPALANAKAHSKARPTSLFTASDINLVRLVAT